MGPTTIWLIALILLVLGEVLTVGLTFIWFAVGALGGLLAAVFGAELWLQIVIFLILSALTMALVRPLAARLLLPHREATNADRVIGQSAVVTQAIDNVEGKGMVKIAGQIWSARSEHDAPIPEGAEVKVLRIEGVKVFVELV